jgi:hypothetical protein
MIRAITRLCFLFVACSFVVAAAAQVNGNKQLQTKIFELARFTQLTIETPAEVFIDASAATSRLEITTDENIFSHLQPQSANGNITIEPDTWIEPSELRIKVYTPSLTTLTTGGYGNYQLQNLQEKSFKLINPVAEVSLNGDVEEFQFRVSTGKLDARRLTARSITATIESFGSARIDAPEYLSATIPENGTLIYQKKPERLEQQLGDHARLLSAAEYEQRSIDREALTKISFRLRNNSWKHISALAEGPEAHRFSYGFALDAGQRRAEEWPIGTKVYQVDKAGMKKLLVTIEEQNAGQVVDLF